MSATGTHRREKREEKNENLQPVLTEQLISELLEKTEDQLLTELLQTFGLMDHGLCLKESSLLDFYFCGFSWTKKMKFSLRQTTFIMSLFHLMITNLRDQQMDLKENLMEFSEALTRQFSRSEKETLILNTEEVCALNNFLENSLFQKYKIYQLMFRTQREELLSGAQRDVEIFNCSSLLPLEEGLSADMRPHDLEECETDK
ncbi:uncharacterized protein cabcoco1 isoform X1 [Xyrichtys novacula]|uniref:Uncharacterized protein cabcoco1 isoform X1 n=1 Tax=Xyrichtys novacula TaxID=13765 RepID=A0AAV1H387_XYRNO|nr:uncharacterized protein cabcoco1 isoform X1 [Xyrichtys novacula]